MTLRELKDMDYQELLGWFSYFELRPPGWREDDRTAKLLQVQGVKKSAHELFPSLAAMHNKVVSSQTVGQAVVGSKIQSFLLNAVGGDVIPL